MGLMQQTLKMWIKTEQIHTNFSWHDKLKLKVVSLLIVYDLRNTVLINNCFQFVYKYSKTFPKTSLVHVHKNLSDLSLFF